jgi:hypothetical protein
MRQTHDQGAAFISFFSRGVLLLESLFRMKARQVRIFMRSGKWGWVDAGRLNLILLKCPSRASSRLNLCTLHATLSVLAG